MKKYVISFLHRGMLFGGFGPIITSIIFYILSLTLDELTITAQQVLVTMVSTYFLAFFHAGASIFNQIESWPIAKGMLFHLLTLYASYVSCYLINSWIPFDITVLLIFTLIFVLTYFLIWTIVVLSLKITSKKLNSKL